MNEEDETDLTTTIQTEIQDHYNTIDKITQQKQKIKKQLKTLETQQNNTEETIEHTLPVILSITTTIPDNEIRVIATANKICIKHEDKIKLLELFRVIVMQLSDAYDVRCYIERKAILIIYGEEEEDD